MPNQNEKTIYELAILGRVTWNLHSLNNEGSIGNVVEPRTLKLANGITTDGISGEMLKHVHAADIWALQEDKSKFCPACAILEPMRAERNPNVTSTGSDTNAAMDSALNDCILCDLHGFLVQRPTIHRDSTIQFGWAVGLEDHVYRDIHQHSRHAVISESRSVTDESIGRGDGVKIEFTIRHTPILQNTQTVNVGGNALTADQDYNLDNNSGRITFTTPPADGAEVTASYEYQTTAQMLYSRPTRSGIYAIVSLFQPWRIGLNTINYQYSKRQNGTEEVEVDRSQRYKLALKAYQTMFWRTDGAMTTTRLPHLEAIEGVLVVSRQNVPVPVISPLKDGYREEIEKLAEASNKAFEYFEFNGISEFVKALGQLENDTPYRISGRAQGT